jgi:hypothetical protein
MMTIALNTEHVELQTNISYKVYIFGYITYLANTVTV